MKDKFYLGLLYGTALPLLTYIFGGMLREQLGFPKSQSFFYIICIGINVIVFRIAIKKEFDNLARGILFTTFIFALFFFFYYFKQS